MSNEMKREVFEKLAEGYSEVSDAYTNETGSPYYRDDEPNDLDEYDAALPDDLPRIPKAVSEHIRQEYGKTTLFDELAWAFQDSFDNSKVNEWITNNEDIFAEAWSRGLWVVKETGEITGYES